MKLAGVGTTFEERLPTDDSHEISILVWFLKAGQNFED